MAGTPKRRAERELIRSMLDELCDQLRQGKSDKAACEALGLRATGALYRLQEEDSAAADRLARARRDGAAAMVSETIDIADELSRHALADPVRVANARIGSRQWLAARRNREAFGDSAKVAVQINVNDMHLTALRAGTALASPVIEGEARQITSEEDAITLNDLL